MMTLIEKFKTVYKTIERTEVDYQKAKLKTNRSAIIRARRQMLEIKQEVASIAKEVRQELIEYLREYEEAKQLVKKSSVPAKLGDVYYFEYSNNSVFNRTLTVVKVSGSNPDDMVFFDDHTHAKQKDLVQVKKLPPEDSSN